MLHNVACRRERQSTSPRCAVCRRLNCLRSWIRLIAPTEAATPVAVDIREVDGVISPASKRLMIFIIISRKVAPLAPPA